MQKSQKMSKFVQKLLRDCGIGEEFLLVEGHSFNEVLGICSRFSKISKVFVSQDVYFIPQTHQGDQFICGQYPVKTARNQNSPCVRLIGRREYRGKTHHFDVILSWCRVAFIGSLQENLSKRELLVDKLIETLLSRKENKL